MAFDVSRAQRTAHRQIARFGGGEGLARLRRGGVDRACTAALLEFSPRERDLILEGARRALVSVIGLAVPPDHEQDLLVVGGEVLRIVLPARGPRPSGDPIFHDLTVVYQSRV